MYLTLETIQDLNNIISELNNIEDEKKRKQFLSEHVEDMDLFLETIKKINKRKLLTEHEKVKKQIRKEGETYKYEPDEIHAIFCKKNVEEIMNEYSLSDLREMYASIYKKLPASGYTKQKIVITLRSWIHSRNRTEAFDSMAAKRKNNL